MIEAGAETLLFGALSLDIYRDRALVLPGGGVLNMAWHWRQLGVPFQLLTRIGEDRPDVFLDFLHRHGVPYLPGSIVGDGVSASIDIVIGPDRQPRMDHFVEGVWSAFRLTADEAHLVASARRLHAVLVEGVIAEVHRLGEAGRLKQLMVSADFLGFRHYTVERFAQTMAYVDVGFVGWPGDRTDPIVAGIRDVVHDLGRMLVVTLGARGVQVFDGRPGGSDRWFDVTPIPVQGTTVGCGDAFIAWFLAEYWRTSDLSAAMDRGRLGGANATAWRRPLPDAAYSETAEGSLKSADQETQEDQDEADDGDHAPDPGLSKQQFHRD